MTRKRIHPNTYNCLVCNTPSVYLVAKSNKYCSAKCQMEHRYVVAIEDWLAGKTNKFSTYVRRYLFEQQGGKCAHCGISDWNGKPIKLEGEHIDGNGSNNKRENLELICPNCHSQTSTYKNRNKGNGRHYRRERYANGQSF